MTIQSTGLHLKIRKSEWNMKKNIAMMFSNVIFALLIKLPEKNMIHKFFTSLLFGRGVIFFCAFIYTKIKHLRRRALRQNMNTGLLLKVCFSLKRGQETG